MIVSCAAAYCRNRPASSSRSQKPPPLKRSTRGEKTPSGRLRAGRCSTERPRSPGTAIHPTTKDTSGLAPLLAGMQITHHGGRGSAGDDIERGRIAFGISYLRVTALAQSLSARDLSAAILVP